ncbi:hypothetical protein QJS04_geneDACA013605 [Acorus gramineus]|uniref:Uncharacterized protein n=1 Tax=Acorus gramineus TaxID=55184 RepID=A0AAV9AHA4_ACOGR|nr:hypothetical protein QJS04_geneDACA013605 [Acorus gramineus]
MECSTSSRTFNNSFGFAREEFLKSRIVKKEIGISIESVVYFDCVDLLILDVCNPVDNTRIKKLWVGTEPCIE